MPTITPRQYQLDAFAAVKCYLEYREGNPCVVLPTGAGKTIILALLCQWVRSWGGRVLILAHVRELLEQAADKLNQMAPDLHVGIYSAGLDRREMHCDITIAGIQSIYQRAREFDPFDLVIIDEAHLLSPDGEGMYRTFLKEARYQNPNIRMVGLTATPYRTSSGMLCGPDEMLRAVCYEADVGDLIEQGYLSKLLSKHVADCDTSGLHVRAGEFVAEEVNNLMMATDAVGLAVSEIIKRTEHRRSVLIFCSSVEHAYQVAGLIDGAEVIVGDTPNRDQIITRFKSGETKYLVNVNVLTTGFDAPGVDCVCILRPTMSPGLYAQMCLDSETEILTNNGWRNRETIARSDLAIAVDSSKFDLPVSVVPIDEIIDRKIGNQEKMFGIESDAVDIRVTGGHDLLVCSRREQRWHKEQTKKTASRKSGYKIPMAAVGEFAGVPLTNDELRLIGWYLTDGTINKKNNCFSVTQSVDSPYVDEIKRLFDSCGIKWRSSIVDGNKSNYLNGKDRIVIRSSKGDPRKEDKGKRGWGYLEKYLKKGFADELMQCTEYQFVNLLDAIFQGNGSKKKTATWNVATTTVCTGLKSFADRLQVCAITRGFRCNIKTGDWNKKPIYMIYIKKQNFRMIGGKNDIDRECIKEVNSSPDESVWCVRNRLGTVITRRRGKVAIMGNCGRGLRLADSKSNTLILDFGNNIKRHGPINRLRIDAKHKGKGKAVPDDKVCPQCQEVVEPGATECPCGYAFPLVERLPSHGHRSSDENVIDDGEAEWSDVMDVKYGRHVKKGSDAEHPATFRVDYQLSIREWISEWVCLEHGGYAGNKARLWWRLRSNDPFPPSVKRAVDMANGGGLAIPLRIQHKLDGKYTRITAVELGTKPEAVEQCVSCGGVGCDDCAFEFVAVGDETVEIDWGDAPF